MITGTTPVVHNSDWQRELADGFREAGRHEVAFDARALSSGTYFYRLDTPTGSQVKKFVIVK